MQHTFDAAWRQRALEGNAEAVHSLAEAALQPLYRFCLYRVGSNRHLCEEVVQETLLRAIRDLAHYEPARAENNVHPWLTGLARNEIHRALAREKPGLSLESLWARLDGELSPVYERLDSEPFSEETLRRQETRELVNATMSQLPARYRETLEAKYVAGHSVRHIAEALGASEKAVESQLSRARQAFRTTFTVLCRNLEAELC